MFRVIIIEDCPIMREILKKIINSIAGFEIIDTAKDAYVARDKIKLYKPDLVTIDCGMPKMNGLTFLKNLMRLHPMPAKMITECREIGYEALKEGALSIVHKPNNKDMNESFRDEIIKTILGIKKEIHRYYLSKQTPEEKRLKREKALLNSCKLIVEKRFHPDDLLISKPAKYGATKVIGIGSSTGGVEALMDIFANLNEDLAPILITQHIPKGFAESFAERLNSISLQNVKTAEGGEILKRGCTYMAPGDKHLMIEKNENGDYITKVEDGIKISRHKPSVDILFRSINNVVGSDSIGIILTGMGDDGSVGMKELYDNGCFTIAQSEATCVVYGMPKQAVLNNAIKELIDLNKIADKINLIGK